MYAPPPYRPMPPKKKGSGCLVAAAVVGGLALLVLAVVGVGAWRAYHSLSPELRSGMTTTWNESMEAGTAPGADALREIGCGATVVDVATMPSLDEMYDAGPGSPEKKIVDCQLNPLLRPVTCDQVAGTYLKSIGGHASGTFRVRVTKTAGQPPICSELRAADGTVLR